MNALCPTEDQQWPGAITNNWLCISQRDKHTPTRDGGTSPLWCMAVANCLISNGISPRWRLVNISNAEFFPQVMDAQFSPVARPAPPLGVDCGHVWSLNQLLVVQGRIQTRGGGAFWWWWSVWLCVCCACVSVNFVGNRNFYDGIGLDL